MFQQLITIAHNTFTESIRQPVFTAVLVVGTLALVLNPMLAAYTFEDDQKLMIDIGLGTLLMCGLMLAAFTATSVLSDEIERRTVLTVVSKPIARPVFVMGKFLGSAVAISLAFWTLMMIFLLTVRHGVLENAGDPFDQPVLTFGLVGAAIAVTLTMAGNFLYRWVFTSTFVMSMAATQTLGWLLVLVLDKHWEFQPISTNWNAQLMMALLLTFEMVLLLIAVAIAASTRVKQIMTLAICFAVFFAGLTSDYMLGRFIETSLFARAMYMLVPNLQFLWMADELTQENTITPQYVALVSGYCMLYVGAALALAVGLFQTREVG